MKRTKVVDRYWWLIFGAWLLVALGSMVGGSYVTYLIVCALQKYIGG